MWSKASKVLLAVLVGGAGLAAAGAPPAGAGAGESVTAIVSAAPGFANGNGNASSMEAAADGRFVAFVSNSTNLIAGRTISNWQLYVRDMLTDSVTLVSHKADGTPDPSGFIHLGGISANGRFVTFATPTRLTGTDTNDVDDVYLWDRTTDTLELASITWNELQSDGDSGFANGSGDSDVSDDGRYVAFTSIATNLSTVSDTLGHLDVFVRDRTLGSTALASIDGAVKGNGDSFDLDLSGTGRYVVFRTMASNWTGTDTNGQSDVWFRDFNTISPSKVSIGADADANSGSEDPSVSDDGRYVAFYSSASDLVAGDSNNSGDIFQRDRTNLTTTRLSVTSAEAQLSAGGGVPSMSRDGLRVAFATTSKVDAADTDAEYDVYVRYTGSTLLASTRSDGSQVTTDAAVAPSITDTQVAWISNGAFTTTDTNGSFDVFTTAFPFIGIFPTFDEFTPTQYQRITGGLPAGQPAAQIALLRAGASPEHFVMQLIDAPAFSAKRAPVIRLYWAYFKRRPDLGGLTFWLNKYASGTTLVQISEQFAKSTEFQTKYGNTTSTQFVTLVYQNILERDPEPAGLSFWANKIDTGTPRGQVMTNFSESSEGKRKIGPRSDAILVALGMYGKIPSLALFDAIVADRQAGWPREITVDYILGSPEYQTTIV